MRIGVNDNHTRGGNKVDVYLEDLRDLFDDCVFVDERAGKIVMSSVKKPGYRRYSIRKSGRVGFNSRSGLTRTSIREVPATVFCGEVVVYTPIGGRR